MSDATELAGSRSHNVAFHTKTVCQKRIFFSWRFVFFFWFFLALELLCSECSTPTPLFFQKVAAAEGERSKALKFTLDSLALVTAKAGLSYCPSILLPPAVISQKLKLQQLSVGFRCCCWRAAGFGWSDPICAHNPDFWPYNQLNSNNLWLSYAVTELLKMSNSTQPKRDPYEIDFFKKK